MCMCMCMYAFGELLRVCVELDFDSQTSFSLVSMTALDLPNGVSQQENGLFLPACLPELPVSLTIIEHVRGRRRRA